MALRAQHFGFSFVIAGVIFGTLAYFAGNTRGASAQSPQLSAVLTPASAQMTVGTMASFNVAGVYTSTNGRSANVVPVTINWVPTGATVASYNNTTVVIKAGTVAKSGKLHVDITYAGLSASTESSLNIVAAAAPATAAPSPTPSPTPSPSPTPLATPGPLTDAETARLEALVSIFRPSTPTLSAPQISLSSLACLEKNLGPHFSGISGGITPPTSTDRTAAAVCFADGDALPAVLAPVPPADVPALSLSDAAVTLEDVKKIDGTADSAHQSGGLLLSGKGTANASIYIYVFSDPVVRHTATNAGGDWTYFLDAALPVGLHEIYAVTPTTPVTFARTSAYPVEITAPATVPVATPVKSYWPAWLPRPAWLSDRILYATGAAVMLLLALFCFIAVIRGRRRRRLREVVPTAFTQQMPGGTVMPDGQIPTMPTSPTVPVAPVSVETIVNTPLPKSYLGSTFLPGGTVPEEYRDDPQPSSSPNLPPKP